MEDFQPKKIIEKKYIHYWKGDTLKEAEKEKEKNREKDRKI